jgi:hypothetical protein
MLTDYYFFITFRGLKKPKPFIQKGFGPIKLIYIKKTNFFVI